MGLLKQGGAVEAREAHNLKVGGSKPLSAICLSLLGGYFWDYVYFRLYGRVV